jgi:hypothetical protein
MGEAEDDQHGHQGGGEGGEGADTGDHSHGRPCIGRQQQAAERFALEQRIALRGDATGRCLELVDLRLRLTGVDGRLDVGLGRGLDRAEVGEGGAVCDPLPVAVDVAGAGLGFLTGVERLIRVPDQVVSSLPRQLLGRWEREVL